MPHTCLRRKVSTNQSLCKDKKSKKPLIKTLLQYHKKRAAQINALTPIIIKQYPFYVTLQKHLIKEIFQYFIENNRIFVR